MGVRVRARKGVRKRAVRRCRGGEASAAGGREAAGGGRERAERTVSVRMSKGSTVTKLIQNHKVQYL